MTRTDRVTVNEFPAPSSHFFIRESGKTDPILLLLTHRQVCQQADGERVEVLQSGLHLQ